MNDNSKAVIIFCSLIGAKKQGVNPLQPKEWYKLEENLKSNNLNPSDLFDTDILENLNIDNELKLRIKKLLTRSSALIFEINKYDKFGIKCLTKYDLDYPEVLKEKLNCPPLLYYCGNLKLLEKKYIGFVGSRNIEQEDIDITHKLVDTCLKNDSGIISGGAKGIDTESVVHCLKNNGCCIEILADSMLKKLKNNNYMNLIRKNRLLCISLAIPEAGFNVGMAMMRNKFIYLFSKGTIVITSSYKTGGTWAGAVECLKNNYSPICVVDNKKIGNDALIKLGAKAINDNWNYEFDNPIKNEQISLF